LEYEFFQAKAKASIKYVQRNIIIQERKEKNKQK